MIQNIPKIFLKNLNETIVHIKDSTKGLDHEVKIIQTKNSKYVIKFPRKNPELIDREFIACSKLKGIIPVPNILFKNKKYIIETYIPGKNFSEVKLTLKERKKIYKELGTILRKIHSVHMKGYGFVKSNGKGMYPTLKKQVFHNRRKYLLRLKKIISEKEYKNVLKFLKENDHYANSKESVMLHYDYENWNIKIYKKRISGIIDFGDLFAGPKSYDLTRPFISHYFDGMFKYFLEGYGKIDLFEIKYYVVISLLWMIEYHKDKNNKKHLKEGLQILKDITN